MHDYILIQSTQLFCKAVTSYPSGGAGYHGPRLWPLIPRTVLGITVFSSPLLPFPAKTNIPLSKFIIDEPMLRTLPQIRPLG